MMHPAFRPLCLTPVLLLAALAGCQTHDRVIYSDRPVKNLRVPSPQESAAATVNADAGAAATTDATTGTAPAAPAATPAAAGALQ